MKLYEALLCLVLFNEGSIVRVCNCKCNVTRRTTSSRLFSFLALLTVLTSFFFLLSVDQERFDLDPQGYLSDWSREGEERTRERTDKGGAKTKAGVWKHQWCLSQVGF